MATVSVSLQVPVLMYHEIAGPSESLGRLAVSEAAFAAQLAYLKDSGFTPITAGELSATLAEGATELPARPIVLTFDDGYESFHSRVMPLLDQHGFTATVFVTAGWVQDAGALAGSRGEPGRMLGWGQIREAVSAGVEVGGHTCWHPQLDQLPEASVRDELYASKVRLEDELGLSVPGLAYPFGYSNALVRQVARQVGYRYAHAVKNMSASRGSDRFAIPRLTVRRATTMSAFRQVVHGGAPITLRQDRALTKGWAVVRYARAGVLCR